MPQTIQTTADASGLWSVESPEAGPLGTYPTEGQAIARAWNVAKTQETTDLVVHSPSGLMRCHLSVRRADSLEAQRYAYEDEEDERLGLKIRRNLPSFDELCARLDRLPASEIDFSQEDDELPC